MRALDFVPLNDLQKKYGTNAQSEGMPDSSPVKPAIVYRPRDDVPRKQLLPYDTSSVLQAVRAAPGRR